MAMVDVRDAYAERAEQYAAALGSIDQMSPADRDFIAASAAGVRGPLLDVGCGPGHWTDFLRHGGAEITGIDPVPEFIATARHRFPLTEYRLGDAGTLGVAEGSLGGILAWYSLIHMDVDELRATLVAFQRALQPSGSLLLGFFDGEPGQPFEHAVARAHYWSADALTGFLEPAGFCVAGAVTRHDTGARPHAAVIAIRGGAVSPEPPPAASTTPAQAPPAS